GRGAGQFEAFEVENQDGRGGQEDEPGGLERPGSETVQAVLASVDKHGERKECNEEYADGRANGGNPFTELQGRDHRRYTEPGECLGTVTRHRAERVQHDNRGEHEERGVPAPDGPPELASFLTGCHRVHRVNGGWTGRFLLQRTPRFVGAQHADAVPALRST